MENVVYVLGAGFSAPLGLPVMSDFLIRAKDMYSEKPDEFEFFKNVFETIKGMHVAKSYFSADLFNIEEILSILEMDRYLQGIDKKSEFAEFISAVINHCTKPIPGNSIKHQSNWYEFLLGHERLWNSYACFLGNLINLIIRNSRGSISASNDKSSSTNYFIVTLNYDMVLENIWNFIKQLSAHVITENPMKEISISKLHGSSSDPSTIIPPTWNKFADKLPKENWKYAWKWLSNANHIRFIGYSLPITDSYVKYLLKAAILKSSNLKTIDVICRDNGEVEKRYGEFIKFDFYRFKNTSVEKYLDFNLNYHIHQFEKHASYPDIGANYKYLEESHRQFMINAKD